MKKMRVTMMYLAFLHKNIMKYLRLTEPYDAEINQILGKYLEGDHIVEQRRDYNKKRDYDNSFSMSLIEVVKEGNIEIEKRTPRDKRDRFSKSKAKIDQKISLSLILTTISFKMFNFTL